MKKILTLSCLLAYSGAALAETGGQLGPQHIARAVPPADVAASTIPASGLRVPLELVGPYPMIRGSVNGQAGLFMLDVGTRMGVLLNNNIPTLGSAFTIGEGRAASGQPLVLQLQDAVARVEPWTGTVLENVNWAHSANFGFIEEGITPDFLGFIGTGLLDPYEFTVDYADRSVFFSPLASDGTPLVQRYDDKDVIATLSFQTADAAEPYTPLVPFTLGEFTIQLGLDTGNPAGDLILTPATKAALEASGNLIQSGALYDLVGLTYGDAILSADEIEVQIGEADSGTLGYSVLRQYKTVWNYKTSTLKLIAP